MSINNIEPIIHIFLHILMINQMLFELLHQLGCVPLHSLQLFKNLLSDLQNLFIDVPTQEMSPFGRILGRLFYVLDQLLDGDVSLLFGLIHFQHDVSNETLVKVF